MSERAPFRIPGLTVAVLALFFLIACGTPSSPPGNDGPGAAEPEHGSSGALAFSVNGAPEAAAAISVYPGGPGNGPVDPARYRELEPGVYTVVTPNITGLRPEGSMSRRVEVTAGETTELAVNYTANTDAGSLHVRVYGLPSGTAGAVQVTGPAPYDVFMTDTGELIGLADGTYTVMARGVPGYETKGPTTQRVNITGGSHEAVHVTYEHEPTPEAKAVRINIEGLPVGVDGHAELQGAFSPGLPRITASQTIRNLPDLTGFAIVGKPVPGWQVVGAADAGTGNRTWRVYPAPGETAQVTVSYVRAAEVTGRAIDVRITGLPPGTDPLIEIQSADPTIHLTDAETIGGLRLSAYAVVARDVPGFRVVGPVTQWVNFPADGPEAVVNVAYEPDLAVGDGTLSLTILGVDGAAAAVDVIRGTETIMTLTNSSNTALEPGEYVLTARPAADGSRPRAPATQWLTVRSGRTSEVTIAYGETPVNPGTGTITVRTEGLDGVEGRVEIQSAGPTVTVSTGDVEDLPTGRYAVVGRDVPGYRVTAPATTWVDVSGGSHETVTVHYAEEPGDGKGLISVEVQGLPPEATADVEIQSSGRNVPLAGTGAEQVPAGTSYAVVAHDVPGYRVIGTRTQWVQVQAGAVHEIIVNYGPVGSGAEQHRARVNVIVDTPSAPFEARVQLHGPDGREESWMLGAGDTELVLPAGDYALVTEAIDGFARTGPVTSFFSLSGVTPMQQLELRYRPDPTTHR